MECIDLERRFPSYRVGYEDPQFKATRDPWHKVLHCRAGHICPAGGSKLWACTDSPRSKAVRTLRQSRFRIAMDGDDGINVEFDVADYREVFEIMGAKKK